MKTSSVVLTLFLFSILSVNTLEACQPMQSMMQDLCYSSCANWAGVLNGECQQGCLGDCGSCPGDPNCTQRCASEYCNSLAQCYDYCFTNSARHNRISDKWRNELAEIYDTPNITRRDDKLLPVSACAIVLFLEKVNSVK